MANTINVLFWVHKSKVNKKGLAPVIIRLTLLTKTVEKATGYHVIPDHWNSRKQRLPSSKANREINERLDEMMVKIANVSRGLENQDIDLTRIIEQVFRVPKTERTLLEEMQRHNTTMHAQVGRGYAFSTYEKYEFTYDKVKAFIAHHLKRKDVLLSDVDMKFIMDFDRYLRINDGNKHNTSVKYCINLKRILNVAVMEGSLLKNPLNSFRTVYKITPQIYLDEQEVSVLENVELGKDSHLLVRDLFIFQCYTGLAYTDMISLTEDDMSTDANGKLWIIKARQKTGVVSTIPLLPKALDVIDRYKGKHSRTDMLFPSYAIQKYNQYISEVGLAAGIRKKLSSHVGRRTFGNVALGKGVSINVISKILGHSNTIITQRIYAITTQQIIDKELHKW